MSIFRRIFEALREYYETKPPQPWWPEDPLEVVVGAVLVQGTTWAAVARVLKTLRENGLLDFKKIRDIDEAELAEMIRSVGFHTKKAKRLHEVARLFLDRSGGDTAIFFARDPDMIRREFLDISGIGPGTADNILLYAGKLSIYMVDPFTRRLLIRHGIVDSRVKDSDIQDLVHRELTPDEEPYGARLFCDFQALLVRLGRDFCGKTNPACVRCPLFSFLPDGGPVGVEESSIRMTERQVRRHPSSAATDSKTKNTPENNIRPVSQLELNDIERKIIERIGTDPVSIDAIVPATGLPVHVVRATIAVLEMRKIVRQVEGNKVRRTI